MLPDYGTIITQRIDYIVKVITVASAPLSSAAIPDTTVDYIARVFSVLIATATLLAMVNLRNGDIAARLKNNTKESI